MSAQVIAMRKPAIDIEAKVKCRECGFEGHSLYKHIQDAHGLSAEDYIAKHPGAELLSPLGKEVMKAHFSAQAEVRYTSEPKSSIDLFAIGFGKATGYTKQMPVRTYVGFTKEHGVPDVDPNYYFPEAVSRDLIMGMEKGGRVYAHGPTGSGKTTWFEQFAARTGRPFWREQMFREKEPVELTGLWVVNDRGAMEYMYSGLVKALQQPSIICFDEYDSGNAVVTAMCNALLEGKPLILGNKGGEKIWPHPECIMVATGNTNGMGDDTGLYASTSVQSFATMNRFRMFVKIDYMPEEKEREVIKRVFPKLPEGRVKNIAKVAKLVRDGYIGGKVSCPLSTRQVLNWADWDMSTGESGRSFRLAFVNQLNETDAKVVGELYQRVYAKSIDED